MCGRGGRRVGWFQLTAARRRLASSIDAKPTPFVVSTHSRPKAAGGFDKGQCLDFVKFQLTAARRRLVDNEDNLFKITLVSTHSRPKAAGCKQCHDSVKQRVSTHSRPKAAGHAEIAEQGMTVENARGTPVDNPAFSRLEKLTRLSVSLSAKLHVHAEATVGKSEDSAKRATKQRQAEQTLENVSEQKTLADFIAQPKGAVQ